MLNQYVQVVQSSRYEQPLVLILVNKTNKQHFLLGKQAERLAKILYSEARQMVANGK